MARNSGILTKLVTQLSENKYAVFPWIGTRELFTLHFLLLQRGIKSKILWRTCVYLEVTFSGHVRDAAELIQEAIQDVLAATESLSEPVSYTHLDVYKRQPKEESARFCLEAIAVTLDAMCRGLLEEYKGLPVLFSGGVCSNSILRQRLQAGYSAYFAQPEFSSDNAAGVALLAERKRCLS